MNDGFGYDLPPGIRVKDIPGCQPGDEEVVISVSFPSTLSILKDILHDALDDEDWDEIKQSIINDIKDKLESKG